MADILQSYRTADNIAPVLDKIINAPLASIDRDSRVALIEGLLEDIQAIDIASKIKPKDAARALLAVKTLAKDPAGSRVLASTANLSTLLSLVTSLEKDADASNEALRCIANCLLLIEEARRTFLTEEVNGGDMTLLLLEKATSPDQIFILCRILFLATALGGEYLVTIVESLFTGRTVVEIVGSKLDLLRQPASTGKPLVREATVDLLKFAFNLLLHYPKLAESEPQASENQDDRVVMGDLWNSRLDDLLPPLLRTYMSLPPLQPCPLAAPLTHTIHALITIPVSETLKPIWFNKSGEIYTGDITQRTYDLLKTTLKRYLPGNREVDAPEVREAVARDSTDSLDDIVTPLVVLLQRLCAGDGETKTRVLKWLIPDDLDRSKPLEQRKDTLGRCLRLLGSVFHPRLKDAVGQLLYALADHDASTLSALVGYGNVAGFLFNQGVLSAPPPPSGGSSSVPTTTASGEEINPITGTTAKPKSDLPEMTDEEKEREMEKLMVLFDRLERTGALPPDQNPIRKAIHEGKIG